MQKVLITGATGLIGSRLSQLLLQRKYAVGQLVRRPAVKNTPGIKTYLWNPEKGQIDAAAFEGVTAIIHLAGAGVADKRWTDARKKEIIDSRVKTAGLIYKWLSQNKHEVKAFISASAVGYYGDCGDEVLTEEHKPGKDFLANVCQKWEAAAIKMEGLGIRVVCNRIGIVLAKNGGALPELTKTLPLGVAGYFAKTPLYYPWVHIDDVCGIFMHAIENENMRGAYNATGPGPVPIKELMREIVETKKAKAVLTPVPPFALKLALGEMSQMLLGSQNCSNQKIIEAGYRFKYATLQGSLENSLISA